MERLFVAVDLPEEARRALRTYLATLPPPPGRPTRPEGWHVTLRFLGAADAERRRRLENELRRRLRASPFAVRLGAPGAFPRPDRARVLWLGVTEGAAALAELADQVEAAAVAAGFPPEPRPFAPHLTLSRLEPPRPLPPPWRQAPPANVVLPVERVTLFRSHLRRGGAIYEPLLHVPLDPTSR